MKFYIYQLKYSLKIFTVIRKTATTD